MYTRAFVLTQDIVLIKLKLLRYANKSEVGTWRSLVAHYAGGVGVAGSNPVVPTIILNYP